MTFLVKMRQSNKCVSVKTDEIINLHSGSDVSPWISIPCLLQETSHIYWFYAQKQSTMKKTKNSEMRYNFQKMVLHATLATYTERWVREVDLESSPNRGSDKINMLKQGRNTQKKGSRICLLYESPLHMFLLISFCQLWEIDVINIVLLHSLILLQ